MRVDDLESSVAKEKRREELALAVFEVHFDTIVENKSVHAWLGRLYILEWHHNASILEEQGLCVKV